MPHGTCTCSYCRDQIEAVKGEGGEKIKKKLKEGRIGRPGHFCPEKDNFHNLFEKNNGFNIFLLTKRFIYLRK
jgi:hypothetical protein